MRKPESELPATFMERLETLSRRERQVFEGVRCGDSSAKIAVDLDINIKTVETHRSHINAKLGVHSPLELVRKCLEAGIGPSQFAERSKTEAGLEAGQYVDVRVSLRVPADWDHERVTGYVADRLHFPRAEEQKHPRGPLLPYVASVGARNLRVFDGEGKISDGQPALHFLGRLLVRADDDAGPLPGGPFIDDFQPFMWNTAGMPEDGFAMGGRYPLSHVLEAFAGKPVSIEVDAVGEGTNHRLGYDASAELANRIQPPSAYAE